MVLRTRLPPQKARPVPRGRPVAGSDPAPIGASRVAWGLLFGHAAANTPVGPPDRIARGTAYSNRFPMTQRRRPSPEVWRVGSYITAFGACSAFTTRCGLSARGAAERPFPSKAPTASLPPPPLRLLPAGAIQLPGGDLTHGKPLPYHGAHTSSVTLERIRSGLSPIQRSHHLLAVGTFTWGRGPIGKPG
jgi:hypothetical protein